MDIVPIVQLIQPLALLLPGPLDALLDISYLKEHVLPAVLEPYLVLLQP